jgi:hypothetical protein
LAGLLGRLEAGAGCARWTAAMRACSTRPARAVMLHLRACYVSKAAILKIQALPVLVENRSPA